MKRFLGSRFFRWLVAPAAALVLLVWGYIQIAYPTCSFRYKLTVDVMTPDGLKRWIVLLMLWPRANW